MLVFIFGRKKKGSLLERGTVRHTLYTKVHYDQTS